MRGTVVVIAFLLVIAWYGISAIGALVDKANAQIATIPVGVVLER